MDRTGYMWFGTVEGLLRYDGHSFKPYLNNPDNPNSISNNNIHDILQDHEGYLWITTRGGGLNRFDPVTETFKRFLHNPNDSSTISGNECNKLFVDSEQNLWVTTFSAGFNQYLPETESFYRIPINTDNIDNRNAEQINTAYGIIEDLVNPNILWLGGGIEFLEYRKDIDSLIFHPNKISINPGRLFNPLMLAPEEIWIGSYGRGLIRFNPNTGNWEDFLIEYNENNSFIRNITIEQLKKKNEDEIWVALSSLGLGTFNKKTKAFRMLNGLSYDYPYQGYWTNIAYDQKDRLWVANREGIKLLDPLQQKLTFQSLHSNWNQSFAHPLTTTDFAIDKNGQLFIATFNGEGVFRFNENGVYQRVKIIYPPNNETKKRMISDVFIDSSNNLWAIDCKKNIIFKYDQLENKLIPYQPEKIHNLLINDFTPFNLLEDRSGNIWVSTRRGGLLKIDTKLDKIDQFVSPQKDYPNISVSNTITGMTIDQDSSNIWLTTGVDGIFVFDLASEKFIRHYPLYPNDGAIIPEGKIKDLSFDKEGKLWVANFGIGVHIIDPEKPIEKSIDTTYSINNCLPSNNVMFIERDVHNNMWIYSFEGLTRYEFDNNRFKTYNENNGLRDIRANGSYGLTALEDGTLCVGQKRGFHRFRTDNLIFNKNPPVVVLSWFKIFEEEHVFENSLNHLEEIRLEYNENFFSIGFAALNFTNPEQNEYRYLLDGFDEDTISSGNRNFASYTNVPPGDYTFFVKAANNDKIWNEEGRSIKIIINPPWYWNTWSQLAYIIVLIGTILLVYRFQLIRQLTKLEIIQIKQYEEAKSQLYDNITHEFRTPLTLILGANDEINGNNKLKEIVKKNTKILLNLINQLLDLAKLKSGNLVVNKVQENIVTYIQYLVSSFHPLALSKKISLSYHSYEGNEFIIDFDKEKIRQIISNLLSNAIKFTPEYGEIRVNTKKISDRFLIEIKDTGQGIPAEEIPRIFDRFHQINTSNTITYKGTGIGLSIVKLLMDLIGGEIEVESKIDQGTIFKLYLPISRVAPIMKFHNKHTPTSSISEMDNLRDTSLQYTTNLPKLLIIEDNNGIIEYLKSILDERYKISISKNGVDGIEKALTIIPDIIITDVMMPQKDGFEVCFELKQNQLTNHIPIIMLTAKANQKNKEKGFTVGADAYLTKPFEKEELFIHLEKLLQLRKLLQAKYQSLSILPEQNEPKIEDSNLKFLQKINKTIEENLSSYDFNVNPHLCRAMAMSRSQLYRKLKALTNTSPSEYLRNKRLEKAHELILQSDLKIEEIARKVGIQNASNFTKFYSKGFGETPQETRNQLNNK
ncbi:MAG: ATP-binding protein [Chitinophagales bacterium]|nr:ATP-binding protein [Chitinophagales bacterium]